MKTLSAVRVSITAFDWRSAMFATWVFLALCGAMALGIWFAQPMRWMLLAASLLAIAVGWCITFTLVSAIFAVRNPRLSKGPQPRPAKQPKTQPPAMKKFFLYFDDHGQEVCKWEPVLGAAQGSR